MSFLGVVKKGSLEGDWFSTVFGVCILFFLVLTVTKGYSRGVLCLQQH